MSTSATVQTPGGMFENCIKTAETSPMIRGVKEYEYFAPGVGLIKYESLEPVDHGFRKGPAPGKTGSGS